MPTEPIQILIADDKTDDLVMLREAFHRQPIAVKLDTVLDGEEALAYLRQKDPHAQAKRPHLVLLDVMIPQKGGFEVLAELKSDPSLAVLPVVLLATSRHKADIERAYALGASGYIAKPVTFDALREIVQAFVGYWTRVVCVPGYE